eukprot:325107_1
MALVDNHQIALLHKLGTLTLSLLTQLIRRYGANHIHIVTNAVFGWIKDSLSYAECIVQVYAQIQKLVTDQRITVQSTYNVEGKRSYIDSILNGKQSNKMYSHIISIGHSWKHHVAVKQSISRYLVSANHPMHHIVKLKRDPTLNDMINQMLYIQTCFDHVFDVAQMHQPVILDYHREEINHYLRTF